MDILYWFIPHTAAEIKWGDEKHEPGERDNPTRMSPKSSFKVFLQVVKAKSLPWK
ncbi:Phytochrome A-2, partial [Stylosanthes scabra]|nr:Phytochrome A-2 [Stylosanthes scabra]